MKKIKVLHIVSSLKTGGVEKLLYDTYKYTDKNNYEFNFITHNEPGMIENLLIGENISVYHLINRRKHPILSAVQFYRFLLKKRFDIIHFHGNFEVLLELIAAKLANHNNLIIHSHNYKRNLPFLQKIIMSITQRISASLTKVCIGCSVAAGYYGFGNIKRLGNYVTIYNGIEIEKYKFDDNKRFLLRKKLKIENDEFVIGTIGRLTKQKNLMYLLKVIESIKSTMKLKVLIVGEGEDYAALRKYVDDNTLNNIVMFLGIRNDVPALLSCFDLFVLTSEYEGLPIVGVEAQAAGLNCIFSNEITQEIRITKNVKFLPITQSSISEWSQNIKIEMKEVAFENKMQRTAVKLQKDFDIKTTADKFMEVYSKIMA